MPGEEEEVPRDGIELKRCFNCARDPRGRAVLRIGRSKHAGRGEVTVAWASTSSSEASCNARRTRDGTQSVRTRTHCKRRSGPRCTRANPVNLHP